MVVNHNMASICESRQLRYNVKKMEKSSKKLATGYKIIGANDDAAGLQISETMRHQTRGLNKASRNSQDGISMLQTADAALQETQDVLGRMVELTTQAANDTHTDADRRSIQDELDQLNQEVDRIAYTTNFNQQYILAEGTPQAAPGYYRAGTATFRAFAGAYIAICRERPRVREIYAFPDLHSGKIGTLTLILHTEDFQMITWHEELTFDFSDPVSNEVFTENCIFFDIETTGFSPARTDLYLIGCATRRDSLLCIDQFFSENAAAQPRTYDHRLGLRMRH